MKQRGENYEMNKSNIDEKTTKSYNQTMTRKLEK